MNRYFIILFVFLSLSACHNIESSRNVASDENAKQGPLPSDFCAKVFSQPPRSGLSLQRVRQAFNDLDMVEGSLGARASMAKEVFIEKGFSDLLENNPELLENPKAIPEGSVYLLRTSAKCLNVARSGHVAIQCNNKMVMIDQGYTDGGLETYKNCITGVMLHNSWNSSEAGTDGDPAEAMK